jgi:UDP-N-acetyl-D-glucosamine dehydrogenase
VQADLRSEALARLRRRDATIAVFGLGYVGLPLAATLARAGHRVVGVDRDPARVAAVNSGHGHVEGERDAEVAGLVLRGRLCATTRPADAAGADVFAIAVPTPLDTHRVPDLSAVRAALTAILPLLRPGALIVLESTTYPGTCDELVVPAVREAGLEPGLDVFVGYSPERVDPGNLTWRLGNTPKLVAGLTDTCLELTAALYESIVDRVVPLSTLQTAEIAKLFENVFRIVNIALVNEFQELCDEFGVDVWEVIEACATKPYGFMPFYPGPGPGGHCVPVDPFYLTWKAREKGAATEFIELADRVNGRRPAYVVRGVGRLLNERRRSLNGAHVALIGVAYKKNVSDVRESPAVPIIDLLEREGAIVTYHDPHVSALALVGRTLRSQPLTSDYLADQDCVVIVTDHDAIDWRLVRRCSPDVLDTRNVLRRQREPLGLTAYVAEAEGCG